MCQAVQATELLTTLPFVFHGPGTEIFGLTLELRERIEACPLLQEVLKASVSAAVSARRTIVRHTVLFLGERCADELLQKAIARRDDTMLVQIMEEFMEDIDGFCGHRRRVPGLGGEVLPGVRITAPIVAERQDQMVLLESRALIEGTSILQQGRGKVGARIYVRSSCVSVRSQGTKTCLALK